MKTKKIIPAGYLLLLGLLLQNCSSNDSSDSGQETESITQIIPASGGVIEMPGTVSASFASGTFDQDVAVTLIKTTGGDDDAKALAKAGYILENMTPYEVRINTGPHAIDQPVTVRLHIPAALSASKSPDYGYTVFGQMLYHSSTEELDSFDPLVSSYSESEQTLEFTLDSDFFTNQRNAEHTFEARVIIGLTPGITISSRATSNQCSGLFISCPLSSCSNITDPYGFREDHPVDHTAKPHRGVDYAAATGTPVYAAHDGKVSLVREMTGYGKTIVVSYKATEGGQSFSTYYAHLNEYNVALGTPVQEGDLIGHSGATGRVSGPHLHFEVLLSPEASNNAERVNPVPLVNNTSPRLMGVVPSFGAANSCVWSSTLMGTPWSIAFRSKNGTESITANSTIVCQMVAPIERPPFSVPVGTVGGVTQVSSPTYCAYFGSASQMKLKAYIQLPSGTQTNCVYFYLNRPAGANRQTQGPRMTTPNISL